MQDYELPLTKKVLLPQIIVSGIILLVGCILATFFFGKAFPNSSLGNTLVTILWIVVPLLWAAGSFFAWTTWPKTTYVFTSDSFQVRKKGLFKAYSEELYRYETILTVTSRRGMTQDYGSLNITLLHLDPITIQGVVGAEQQARKLKEMIAQGQPRVQTIAP